ncbi:MAG: ABC transporter permease [Anaerolineae bacterium]|jgi:ribose/xylose/arabinose/galactoside ABC-type transport system permease subunit|nr:ABC transporter permease [Anaerolineae bacterium]
MNARRWNPLQFVLNNSTLILFALVFIGFSLSSPRFFTVENVINFVKQASFTGIIAVGMTFVLLTAGIDLSVGSNMYLSAVVSGLLMRTMGLEVLPALLVALATGTLFGAINAFFIVNLRIIPFMVTLSTLVIGRGIGTALTESQQIDLPQRMATFGQGQLAGIPMPILLFALVVLVAYFILTRTPFGRQVYAVGNDVEAAKKAGINTDRVIFMVYLVSGFCAALAGFVLASQVIRVDRSFAEGREFDAIAASVLGGTSLFGGVGNVYGAMVGAVLIQMVQTGLQFNQVNLYLQPMVRAFIIFITVFFDSLRETTQARLKRRFIRPVENREASTPART